MFRFIFIIYAMIYSLYSIFVFYGVFTLLFVRCVPKLEAPGSKPTDCSMVNSAFHISHVNQNECKKILWFKVNCLLLVALQS